MSELEVLQDLQHRAGLKRLLEHCKHLQPLLLADALDVLEHGRAPAAHELDVAAVAFLAQRDDALDRVGGCKRDVEKDEVGRTLGYRGAKRRAIGEFFGVDADTVQNKRQEMPDARIPVDDEAERDTRGAVALPGVTRRRAGGRGCRLRCYCAHCQAYAFPTGGRHH